MINKAGIINKSQDSQLNGKKMFTIDLLKGEGIPPRTGLTGISFTLITVAAPVILIFAVAYLYSSNNIAISISGKNISKLEDKIDKYSDVVEIQSAMAKEKVYYSFFLSELKPKVEQFTQWTPIITTLVQHMPDSVTLKQLKVWQDVEKRKVPSKDDPEETTTINVPIITMRLVLADNTQANNDKAVADYQDYLLSCPSLGPKLEKIIPSKKTDSGQYSEVNYIMDCVFKAPV